MCLLLESIKMENGALCHVPDHEERMNRSRRDLFGLSDPLFIDVKSIDNELIDGIRKCRILYSDKIHSIELIPYNPRTINRMYIVEMDCADYSYKYANRSIFDSLPPHDADEDYLIVKNGFITDTTYSNIAFFDGSKWFTPSTFLLNGTQRQRLLRAGKLISCAITPTDLCNFQFFRPINAMLHFETTPPIDISAISQLENEKR